MRIALSIVALLLLTRPAAAETALTVSYPIEQVYPAALRFLALDEKLAIVDKDADAGYIVFELEEDGATFRGSMELAAVTDSKGRKATRVIVSIADRPAYMELGLLDRFHTKLRKQLGRPAKPPPAPAPEPPPPDDKKPDAQP